MTDLKSTIKSSASSIRPTGTPGKSTVKTPVGPPVPTPLPKQGAVTTYNYPSNTGAVSNVPVKSTNQEKPGGVYTGAGYAVNQDTGQTTPVNYPAPSTSNPNPSPSQAQPAQLAGKELTTDQLQGYGIPAGELWNENVVTIDGQKYRVKDTGRGTRTLEAVNEGGGGEPTPPVSRDDVLSNIPEDQRSSIDQNALDEIMKKYGLESRDRAKAIADELLSSQTEMADREYQEILKTLGVQKGEVSTVAEQQKRRVGETKEAGLLELADKEETETKNIEKQKTEFLEEQGDTREVLARNWRDMSLQVQSIMRARGTTDSSFAAGKETDVLLEFNRGLRALAKEGIKGVENFGEALVETNKFYTREKNKLEVDSRQQLEDIDTWVRQRVQDIQSQEGMALVKKLNSIRAAVQQGNELKIKTEQSISDKQFALDSWLIQTQINYKNSVALAAQGKTQDAVTNIGKYRDMAKEAYDLVTKGGYEFQVVQNKDGTVTPVVHGKLPNGEDDYIQLTEGGFDTLTQNVYGSLTKSNDPYGLGQGTNIDPTSINAARSAAGLPAVGGDQATQESPSLINTILGAFRK